MRPTTHNRTRKPRSSAFYVTKSARLQSCRTLKPWCRPTCVQRFGPSSRMRRFDDRRKRHVQWDGAATVMNERTFWFLAGLRRRLYDSILLDSTQPWSPPASRDVVSRAEVGMTSGAVESRTATCTRLLLSLPTPATNTWPRRPHEAHLFPGSTSGPTESARAQCMCRWWALQRLKKPQCRNRRAFSTRPQGCFQG